VNSEELLEENTIGERQLEPTTEAFIRLGGEVSDRLTIGQFSKLTWLSIKALRLYDELGLLPPAHVAPDTGYRFYEPPQAGRARAIALLRSLDMPLVDIKELLSAEDTDKLRALLKSHHDKLTSRLERDRRMLERVEVLIEKGAIVTYEVKLKDIDPVVVAGVTFESSPETIGPEAGRAYARLFEFLAQEAVAPSAPPRLVYHAMGGDGWKLEACVPVSGTPEPRDGIVVREFPGGQAAVAMHRGPYDELGMAYREIEQWMEKGGYRTTAPPYDVYLNDPQEVDDPADYLTEVTWPVTKS
jgi:effector-binding domain-containing protein